MADKYRADLIGFNPVFYHLQLGSFSTIYQKMIAANG